MKSASRGEVAEALIGFIFSTLIRPSQCDFADEANAPVERGEVADGAALDEKTTQSKRVRGDANGPR